MKTRLSYQRGWIEERRLKDGETVYVLRWYVRDATAKNGWRKTSETLRDCASMKAAKKMLDDQVKETNRVNEGTAPVPMTFAEFATGVWLEYLENKAVRESTRYSYDAMLRHHLLPEFAQLRLAEITPLNISNFFAKLRPNKLSAHYQLNIYAMLRTMFEVALEHDLVSASPVRKKLHRPKLLHQEKPTLSVEEIGKILEQIPEEWKPLFLLDMVTGLRAGELLGLQWKNIDWMGQKLHVTHALWRGKLYGPKTEASRRVIHLPEVILETLRLHRQRSRFTDPDDFVFCKAEGSACDPNDLRDKVLYPAMDRANIKRLPRSHGFHLFRHTAGSLVHAETQDLKLAQEMLGHARLSTTADIYLHSGEKGAKQATELLAKLLLGFCPLFAHSEGQNRSTVQ